jgi:uncharacterized protein (DUF1800 family)
MPQSRLTAALALHRFGFGPRADGLAATAGDPRGFLLAELDRPQVATIVDADLLSSGEAARAAVDFRREHKAQRLAAQIAAPVPAPATKPAPAAAPSPPAANPGPGIPQQIYLDEAKARLDAALAAETGFVERLVWFWSNHFCVSADKVRPLAGAFEREAIRPHVTGRFADMLMAVESHPAMRAYLDNAGSIGPDSVAGVRRHKGLNENLAREILELHTLGVDGGYAQDDVTGFAKIITGWTVIPAKQDDGGVFAFNERMHEPGVQQLLGRRYAQDGVAQGQTVLADFAHRPAGRPQGRAA